MRGAINRISPTCPHMSFKAHLVASLAEDAVGAGSVASTAMPLFQQVVSRLPTAKPVKKRANRVVEADDSDATTSAAVVSHLQSLEKRDQSETHRNVAVFGLEDEKGQIIKVSVQQDQAADFEKALQAVRTQHQDDRQPTMSIAEVLFQMKSQFNITDIDWPRVEEDEEQPSDVQNGEASGDGDQQSSLDDEDGISAADTDMDGGADTGSADAASILTQVIDMMKADAEARTADARAREAEARNRESEAAVAHSMNRIKQEEQMLDMETEEKARKAEEKEARRLAQLAKWKSSISADGGDQGGPLRPNREMSGRGASGEENEEVRSKHHTPIRGKASVSQIASLILSRIS